MDGIRNMVWNLDGSYSLDSLIFFALPAEPAFIPRRVLLVLLRQSCYVMSCLAGRILRRFFERYSHRDCCDLFSPPLHPGTLIFRLQRAPLLQEFARDARARSLHSAKSFPPHPSWSWRTPGKEKRGVGMLCMRQAMIESKKK